MFSSVSTETEIVIIDDSLTNLILLSSCLKSFGLNQVRIFSDSAEGLEWLMNNRWNLALLDLDMPSPNGFEVLDCLNQRNRAEYPIIIVTALNDPESRRQGLERGANDFISKPIDLPEVLLRVRGCLELAEASRVLRNANVELERKVEERTAQLEGSYKAIINSLTRAASYRDDDTGEHIQRIGESAAILAKAIDMPPTWCDLIRMAAPMHDVGKIGIEDAILQKPGPLTDEERKSMQRHARIGYDILLDPNRSAVTDMAAEIALAHHERWDGQGYPNGLKGDAIPLSARIVAICDVYDALRMPRPYKKAWNKEEAQHYIRDQEGTHFDPHLVKVFCTLFDSIEALRELKS